MYMMGLTAMVCVCVCVRVCVRVCDLHVYVCMPDIVNGDITVLSIANKTSKHVHCLCSHPICHYVCMYMHGQLCLPLGLPSLFISFCCHYIGM